MKGARDAVRATAQAMTTPVPIRILAQVTRGKDKGLCVLAAAEPFRSVPPGSLSSSPAGDCYPRMSSLASPIYREHCTSWVIDPGRVKLEEAPQHFSASREPQASQYSLADPVEIFLEHSWGEVPAAQTLHWAQPF